MLKEEVIIKFNNREILEKTACKFGNSAHILVFKDYIGKEVKLIAGESEVINNEVKVNFSKSEIFDRKITRFGTGAHVIIPKEYSNEKLKLLVEKSKK